MVNRDLKTVLVNKDLNTVLVKTCIGKALQGEAEQFPIIAVSAETLARLFKPSLKRPSLTRGLEAAPERTACPALISCKPQTFFFLKKIHIFMKPKTL